MANYDQPDGLIPNGQVHRCRVYIAASAIYPGDACKLNSDGKVEVAAAGDALVGAAAEYASGDGQSVKIWDNPDQEYMIQASGTEIDAQTDMNLNYDILANTASTKYKQSRHELDSSTGAVSSSKQLKLLRIDARPDNTLGTNVDCIVIINNHVLKGGTGTLGV